MALTVSAAQAAWLVDRHERIVRNHVTRQPGTAGYLPAVKQGHTWAISTDDLERVPGWRVDAQRLRQLEAADARTVDSQVARITALETRMRSLETRLALVERMRLSGVDIAPDPLSGDSDNAAGRQVSSHAAIPPLAPVHALAEPPSPSFSLTYRTPEMPATFRTHADAGRFMARHGVNERTVKSWPGWRSVELTPRAVLDLALTLYNPTNWRITWRLQRCDDPTCVCREMLLA
jgi:hypothetical protein